MANIVKKVISDIDNNIDKAKQDMQTTQDAEQRKQFGSYIKSLKGLKHFYTTTFQNSADKLN